MTGAPGMASGRRWRGPRLAWVAAGLATSLLAPAGGPAAAAELSVRGSYTLEPQVVDNLDLDRAVRDDRRTAFVEHEFRLVLSIRTGAVEAAVGFELADGLFGRQHIRDPASPFDDGTSLQLSPDTETNVVDFFWVRWPASLLTVRAGWFTTDLGSYRFFLGEDGAPSLRLERPLGPVRVEYTYQKVAERAGISETPSSPGGPVVEAPRSTLPGVGDVDAHYLLLDVRAERLRWLSVDRAALWTVYAADRRPDDRAWLAVAGGQLDLGIGPLALYGEVDYLEGRYRGVTPVALRRAPGGAGDEVLGGGATLRGHVAFLGLTLDLGEVTGWLPVAIGVEALAGSGDRDPADGRAEDVTALTIVHENLDDDFELSRLFGAFVVAGHAEYFERVANLESLKPFVVARPWRGLELSAAAYRLRTTRSVALGAAGAGSAARSRDLGWQYEGAVRVQVAAGVAAALAYLYLDPGPALRPGGDPAELLYGSLAFRF